MKLGVVHFGSFSIGAMQIVASLIEGITKYSYHLYGIEYSREASGIDLIELHKKNIEQAKETGNSILKSFPEKQWMNQGNQETLSQLDVIVVLGGRAQQIEQPVTTLHVPFSIFNDIEDSQFTLGFDTALNSITNDIEKIRDTASSLSYAKVRVFNVQIPGEMSSSLVSNVALAVDGTIVTTSQEQGINQMKNVIREKELNGEGYCFMIMDRSVDPMTLEQPITSELDVDWKVAIIDESQCVGPFPTALDKIYTKKMISKIFNWIETNKETGKLVIQNHKVLFHPTK